MPTPSQSAAPLFAPVFPHHHRRLFLPRFLAEDAKAQASRDAGLYRTLLLQIDYDQAAFAVSSGAIAAPRDWNGTVDSIGPPWEQFDPETIAFCSDEYVAD